jgi:hypothetical protein
MTGGRTDGTGVAGTTLQFAASAYDDGRSIRPERVCATTGRSPSVKAGVLIQRG